MTLLKATHLRKTFPGVVALDDVSIDVEAGSIHALVGANGAGKSTLIKILSGFYATYEGLIEINQTPVSITQPKDALRYGIEVVHQEVDTALVPSLSVAENLVLEQLAENRGLTWVKWRSVYAQARQMLAVIGLDVDVRKAVDRLSLHEKQLMVIARALSRKVKVLILDEPTAALSEREVDRLFTILRKLRAQGVGIIYISHRLSEVRQIADQISVLRSGKRVDTFPGTVATAELLQAMLGIQPEDIFPVRLLRTPGKIVLETKGLTRRGHVRGIDLTVRQGEILGITGMVGAGKTELLRLLFGVDGLDGGGIWMDDKRISLRRPQDAVAHGIYLVPEERRKQGLHVENSVRSNISLPFLRIYSRVGFILHFREKSHAEQIVKHLNLHPPRPEMAVRNLSGGNQQKVVIGKWIGQQGISAPRLLLFDEATQGIDVKAKRDVYNLVQTISKEAGVIYASSDIDEALAIADRLLVMRDGRVVADLDAANTSREKVLELATGSGSL